ncbi:MAG: 2OG-Fe(II) oxygenase [Gammaproteobacteria bacterium]|nr:2OG-Fe(II) oxygenase [Gammaproteobacteria bacterium]
MNSNAKLSDKDGMDWDQALFDAMARNLEEKGFSIHPLALNPRLTHALEHHVQSMPLQRFDPAGIGRDQKHRLNDFVRTDEIAWITGESEAGRQWLAWAANLQKYLNRRLMLGLFSFESHFAHYAPGAFYKKHRDAFKGEANRVLSLVVYLNPSWSADDGGELVLYLGVNGEETLKVVPGLGTVVAFLSEEFPHEVLPSRRDRYSIAGWYRINASVGNRIDPPR